MTLPAPVVLVRGSGDVGSAVAHRLFTSGRPVVIHDVALPAAPRRGMAFTDAIFERDCELEGVRALRVDDLGALPEALAARVAGKGRARISLEHILPNLAALLVVQGTIQFSLGVIAEAGLSYVGLGAQPPSPSWGRMLNEAQSLTALDPALALFPGGAVVLLVLGLNLLGDGLGRGRGL